VSLLAAGVELHLTSLDLLDQLGEGVLGLTLKVAVRRVFEGNARGFLGRAAR